MWYNILLAALFGVLEGVTEWLPISSTGHLILLENFIRFPVSDSFFELFEVVIQLGAILAVAVLYFHTLNPFSKRKTRKERGYTWRLWGLILLAVTPSAVAGLLLDDLLDTYLYNAPTVAAMLILYGALFILLEKKQKNSVAPTERTAITPRTALCVGLFQILSLVPGTSRSGATVLGGLLLGLSRTAAAEFSFFLGIPTMLGASGLKTAKFFMAGNTLCGGEWPMLGAGALTAFAVSMLTIRALRGFVRRHSSTAFGVYRILLGACVIAALLI